MMAYKKIETLTAHKHNMPRTCGRTCSSRTQTPALLTWVCCTLVVEKHSDCQRSTFPHSPGENVHSFCHEVVKVAGRNFSTSACLTWSNNATDTQFHYVKADLGQMGRGLVNPTGERLLLWFNQVTDHWPFEMTQNFTPVSFVFFSSFLLLQ